MSVDLGARLLELYGQIDAMPRAAKIAASARLDAAVAAYRANPSRAAVTELMTAQRVWGAAK